MAVRARCQRVRLVSCQTKCAEPYCSLLTRRRRCQCWCCCYCWVMRWMNYWCTAGGNHFRRRLTSPSPARRPARHRPSCCHRVTIVGRYCRPCKSIHRGIVRGSANNRHPVSSSTTGSEIAYTNFPRTLSHAVYKEIVRALEWTHTCTVICFSRRYITYLQFGSTSAENAKKKQKSHIFWKCCVFQS